MLRGEIVIIHATHRGEDLRFSQGHRAPVACFRHRNRNR